MTGRDYVIIGNITFLFNAYGNTNYPKKYSSALIFAIFASCGS